VQRDLLIEEAALSDQFVLFLSHADDKVTVLESEKRAWESSPEAQAIKEALNPWGKVDEERK